MEQKGLGTGAGVCWRSERPYISRNRDENPRAEDISASQGLGVPQSSLAALHQCYCDFSPPPPPRPPHGMVIHTPQHVSPMHGFDLKVWEDAQDCHLHKGFPSTASSLALRFSCAKCMALNNNAPSN